MASSTIRDYDVAENHRSYKGKKVAARKALEWANCNTNTDDVEIALGVPFRSTMWNGRENIVLWLAYDISATDEGWTITSYRWYSNPSKARCYMEFCCNNATVDVVMADRSFRQAGDNRPRNNPIPWGWCTQHAPSKEN